MVEMLQPSPGRPALAAHSHFIVPVCSASPLGKLESRSTRNRVSRSEYCGDGGHRASDSSRDRSLHYSLDHSLHYGLGRSHVWSLARNLVGSLQRGPR